MKSVVYYFSATGNNLFVARELAMLLDAALVPIPSLINENKIIIDSEAAGIVFPVYYNRIPVIIERFLEKAEFRGNGYFYSVCTFGGGPGETRQMVQELLKPKNMRLTASFCVHMTQNAFFKFWEKPERINRAAKRKIRLIAKRIRKREAGMLIRDRLVSFLLSPLNILVRNAVIKSLAGLSGTALTAPLSELINKSDAGFGVTDACNSCGICVNVCPVDNIRLTDGKPEWLHKCENCIACYNWCPNKAISSKIPHNNYYYTNPEIRVKDIIAQKK